MFLLSCNLQACCEIWLTKWGNSGGKKSNFSQEFFKRMCGVLSNDHKVLDRFMNELDLCGHILPGDII